MTYPIPAEALDDRLGFVGTTGSGKTYNAGSGVERLLDSGARVIVVDPLDVWWGLRASANGKKASPFKLPIFGGAHGDLPLVESAGAVIGETVAGMKESCIVSLGGFTSGASERRFMLAFLTALYRHTKGAPVHLVLDEADLWSPQQVMDKDGDAMKLKGQVQTLVRRGRVKGFIPWLITQRPAVIDKSVLSQVDGLVAFKLTSSQDRAALGAWIQGQADEGQGREILASLPTLPRGTGVVWIPGRGILQTAAFPAKVTFDSSRTPARGEVVEHADLKPLDLGALKDRLAAVAVEAVANDPKALKAEVAQLRRELSARTTAPDAAATKAAEEAALLRGVEEGEQRGNIAGQSLMLTRLRSAVDGLRVGPAASGGGKPAPARPAPAQAAPRPQPAQIAAPVAATPAPAGDFTDAPALTGPQRAVLRSLAWWRAMGKEAPTRNQVAVICGWSTNSSNIRDRCSELFRLELIDRPIAGHLRLTPAGIDAAPEPDLGQTLLDSLRLILTRPQQQVVDALLGAEGGAVSRDQLAISIGWSTNSSNIRDRLSELARLDIIERPSPGMIALQEWVTA